MSQKHQSFVLTIGLIGAFIAGVAPFFVVPYFDEKYTSYGWALPLATRLLLDFYAAFLVLPVLAVLIWRFWPNRANRSAAAAAFGIACFVLVIPLVVAALYLPFWHGTPTIQ